VQGTKFWFENMWGGSPILSFSLPLHPQIMEALRKELEQRV
jgi:hypothetical protein